MSVSFASRLKSARLMKGYSLQDLANKIDIDLSRQSLHKYEKGLMMPDSAVLNALCRALEVSQDYLFRQTEVSLGKIEFRKLTNLPKKEEAKIVEACKDYLSRYIEIESILGIEKEFEHPLKDFGVADSLQRVVSAAKQLRKAWNLGTSPIYNIAELLEDKHIKVVELDADLAFDGLQTWVNNNIPVVAFNRAKVSKSDRIRFTLLHELGHLLLDFGSTSQAQVERLCHQFAGAMLLPEENILQELGANRTKISMNELGGIKKQYGISMQAIVMRAADCGIINEHYKKSFFFMMKQMGWRETEPVDYTGEEQSHRFNQLVFRALAEEQITMSKAAALKNMKLAEFTQSTSLR